MAKTDKGVFGVSGKMGPVVFFEKFGKTFVRMAPEFPKKRTFTAKQELAKTKFAKVNTLMRYIKRIANQTYIEQKGKGSVHHKMVGQIYKYAIKGDTLEEIQIVPELLPLSFGSLVPDASFSMIETQEQVQIKWDAEIGAKSDTVSIIVLAEYDSPSHNRVKRPLEVAAHYSAVIHTKSQRADKYVEIAKSEIEKSPFFRIWLYAYFTNEDKSLCSPSTYLGIIEKA